MSDPDRAAGDGGEGNAYRIGAVSFLNSKPLIEGLAGVPGVRLRLAVPAKLAAMLQSGQIDVGLVPAVDFGRHRDLWQIVSDGCIASDGQTMTVRIFSRVPPDRITMLHVDGDSHTSVVLAQVLWRRLYERPVGVRTIEATPEVVEGCEAVLLIGDKVVGGMTQAFGYEIDLGAAWRQLVGLPFVFAVWVARKGAEVGDVAAILNEARDRGVARAAELARVHGPGAGWPAGLAERYLTQYLSYTLTPRHRRGLELFLEMAGEYGLLREGAAEAVGGDAVRQR